MWQNQCLDRSQAMVTAERVNSARCGYEISDTPCIVSDVALTPTIDTSAVPAAPPGPNGLISASMPCLMPLAPSGDKDPGPPHKRQGLFLCIKFREPRRR